MLLRWQSSSWCNPGSYRYIGRIGYPVRPFFLIYPKNRQKTLDKSRRLRYYIKVPRNIFAAIAQPVERILGKDEVASSNLASSSSKKSSCFCNCFFCNYIRLRRVILLRSDICFASDIRLAPSFGGEYNITTLQTAYHYKLCSYKNRICTKMNSIQSDGVHF